MFIYMLCIHAYGPKDIFWLSRYSYLITFKARHNIVAIVTGVVLWIWHRQAQRSPAMPSVVSILMEVLSWYSWNFRPYAVVQYSILPRPWCMNSDADWKGKMRHVVGWIVTAESASQLGNPSSLGARLRGVNCLHSDSASPKPGWRRRATLVIVAIGYSVFKLQLATMKIV